MKKKEIIAIVVAALLSIIIITTCYFIADARRKENLRVRKQETHSMLIKIKPLVKLTFKEEYYLCDDKKENKKGCGKHLYNVSDFEFVDEEAKTIYKDLDLKDKNLYQAILLLCETASSNKISFDKVEIFTDSSSIDDGDILDYLKSNSKSKVNFLLNVDYQKYISVNKVLKEDENEVKKTTYLVTFNSDGGSEVEVQTVEEGQMATKPANPTRTGYSFIEWRLNGKAFNFNTPITENITLEAQWEKSKNSNYSPQNQAIPNNEPTPSPSPSQGNDNEGSSGNVQQQDPGSNQETEQKPEETPTQPEQDMNPGETE